MPGLLTASLPLCCPRHQGSCLETRAASVLTFSRSTPTLAGVSRSRSSSTSVRPRQAMASPVVAPMSDFQTTSTLCSDLPEWQALKEHFETDIQATHLKELMQDTERVEALSAEHNGVYLDYSRQRVTQATMGKLLKLAEATNLRPKMDAMFAGEHINSTEDRAVLHTALRAPRSASVHVDGKDVIPDVHAVLDKIAAFSDKVRSGQWLGATGKPLTDCVCIGIGGSFLGPLFVHTALRTNPAAAASARGQLRFLANVDPVDVARALNSLNQETTLVVIVSKTFTTAETMLNARTVRSWIVSALGKEAVAKHMVAVSTNIKLVSDFGIDPANAFAFWDWVGGRYSVCSAVGMLPLSLHYGAETMRTFLAGAHDMDEHFRTAPFERNLPVIMGLTSVWNTNFLDCPARAILPYAQALAKLAPHMQQVSMESNGKGVALDGTRLPFSTGEVDFGEPGTNGQHSFYQLIHQGRVIPAEFIGVVKSQQSVYLKGEIVSNHDELMCNFFAQADALAVGKSARELRAEGCPDSLIPHKVFTGNRPSLSLLLPELSAFTIGQLLSLYEARTAVQGFVWGLNSFDQWGVELGKVLAGKVRGKMSEMRTSGTKVTPSDGFNPSTEKMLNKYLQGKTQLLYPEPRDVFPSTVLH